MMPTPFSGPAGVITAPTEIDTFDMKNIGFQLRSCTLLDRLRGKLGNRRDQQHVRAGCL